MVSATASSTFLVTPPPTRAAAVPATPRRRCLVRLVGVLLAALIVSTLAPLTGQLVGDPQASAPVAAADPSCPKVPIIGTACKVGGAIINPKKAITDAATSGFKGIVQSMMAGEARLIELSMSWFIKIPTPQAGQWAPVQQVQAATLSIQLILLVVSIILGGFRLMMAKRNTVYAEGEAMFHSLMRTIVGVWTFGGLMTAMSAAVDIISNDILNYATHNNPGQVIANMAAMDQLLPFFGSGLMFVISIVGILSALLQVVLLVVRQAMLAVIVSLMPVIACASGTSIGSNAYRNITRWAISLLLWKFVAALVYMVAFVLASAKTNNPEIQFYGLILLLMASAVLPILTRLVSGGMAMAGASGLTAATMAMGVIAAGGSLAAAGKGLGGGGSGGSGKSSGSTASTAGAGMAGGPIGMAASQSGGNMGGKGGQMATAPMKGAAQAGGAGLSGAGEGTSGSTTNGSKQSGAARSGTSSAGQQGAGSRSGGSQGNGAPTQASTPGTAARDTGSGSGQSGASTAPGGSQGSGGGGTPASGSGGTGVMSSAGSSAGHVSDAAGHIANLSSTAQDVFSDSGSDTTGGPQR
ncbi:hypothetical protein [Williamsia sterculiae]|uniref:TrbL/VirB6 plasmid conjugal transfer protein n=1 Tax=Williamsia sterculiae TaxID=1344003 RepID=A0A1N7HEG5_9NOCA|nr:hypothetical protein [Williamsia sterculiae]SIS23267.1 hypothetical protein SAMN05445060_4086 [Williamsia sterculiae]